MQRPILYRKYWAVTPFELSVASCMDVLTIAPIDINSILEPAGYDDEAKYRPVAESIWTSACGRQMIALVDDEGASWVLTEGGIATSSASVATRALRHFTADRNYEWPRKLYFGDIPDVGSVLRLLLAIEDRESADGQWPAINTPLLMQVDRRSSEFEAAIARLVTTGRMAQQDLAIIRRLWFPNVFGEVLIAAASRR